jgi:hypothetical protein
LSCLMLVNSCLILPVLVGYNNQQASFSGTPVA